MTSVETWYTYVELGTLAVFVAAFISARTWLKYTASDAGERRHLRTIRSQLLAGSSTTVRIREGFDESDVRDRIRYGILRENRLEVQETTVRELLGDISEAVDDARPSWLPPLAWRGLAEALALFLVGMLALAPLSWWRSAVDPSSGAGDPIETGSWLLELGQEALLSFPYATDLVGLLLAAGILGASAIWGVWLLLAVVLVIGAGAIALLRSRVLPLSILPDDHQFRPPHRTGLRILGALGLLWAVGTAVSETIHLLGYAEVGEVFGILAVGILALALVVYWLAGVVHLVGSIGDLLPGRKSLVVAYVLVRPAYIGLLSIGALLVPSYLVYAVVSGRLLEVADVILEAPLWVQPILVGALLSIPVILALNSDRIVDEIRDVVERISRSTALRLWLVTRAMPLAGTITVVGIVFALSASLLVAGIAGAISGAFLAIAGQLVGRIKYRLLSEWTGRDRSVDEVHAKPYRITDGAGEEIYVVEVDGRRYAHRELDPLLDDVVEALEIRTTDGGYAATESDYYAEEIEKGRVDLEKVRLRLEGDIWTYTRRLLSDHGDRLDEELARETLEEQYPSWLIEWCLTELRRRGQVDRRQGDLVLLS